MDIKYNVLNYDSTHGNTRLELSIKGDDINYVILNTLRRTIMTNIPIYAFTEFNFKKNNKLNTKLNIKGNYNKKNELNILFKVSSNENFSEIFFSKLKC